MTIAIQKADDPARNLRNVWLGPDAWRWPFDARYSAWAVWLATTVLAFVACWLVVPFFAIVLLGAWLGSSALVRSLGWSRRWRWTFTAGAGLIALRLAPTLVLTHLPMPFAMAAVAAPLIAVAFTRAVMPHVSPNTPVKYWKTLPALVANGPRPSRAPAEFHPLDTPIPEPVYIHPWTLAALERTGGSVARFSSNEVIEAKRLAPKVSTEEGGDFIAWLGEYGYGHAVEPDGGITIFDPKAMVEVLIKKGQWAYFHPSPADDQPTDALTVVDHADFQGNWEKTGTGG